MYKRFRKKMNKNDLCWCKSGIEYKDCHEAFDEKIARYKAQGCIVPPRKIIKNQVQIDGLRESGKINIAILDFISDKLHIGMTTNQIDALIHEKTLALGGIPATLNYEGYTKSVCTSINDQVCHGIPSDDVILKDGDIINIDVSTIYNGYFSDSSRMFCIGNTSAENRRLVDVTKACIEVGLAQVKPWGFLGDMGQAIHEHALNNGYTVVQEIGGHGIGLQFHEEPWVSFVSKKGTEMLLVPGMVFTIEPMLNQGSDEIFLDEADGWTVYTADGKPSAQWEVMVLVTNEGYEILAY
ncbi:type I methionyl aminopeptidase [Fusibacter ferrireducens]|uniref:Methionine aminopeptidase n=1 Tax=Fusibacter ferrireducens TaxID=2785058 RepID=A0ABR9ZRS5_9FIRM|nr:type I methionyl aminopeptidase [Fusibacter ferrireducens]MBF4693157.1 type I methionyl aminopeptidase [Fusibacter ferrireducens]